MKSIIEDLNKAFENKVRLGVMSVLMVNDFKDFTSMKELLDVTDGNLSSHVKALEKNGYLKIDKMFVDRKPKTTYSITEEGREAFKKHIEAIEKLLG